MERIITLCLLSILLVSCTPPISTNLTITAISPTVRGLPTQAPTHTPISTPEATPTPISGSDFILERIAQTGGRISGITVVGDIAYVGMGPRVAAINLSQPDNPQLIYQSEPLPGAVTLLIHIEKASASFLMVAAGRYLVLMETSHPEELESVQQMALVGAITALVWDPQQGMAYVGGSIYQGPDRYSGYLSAIELTAANRLLVIDSTDMPERPLSLALGQERLYAGAEGYRGGLYDIQLEGQGLLSDPRLLIASTPIEPLQPMCMQVIGNRLFLSYQRIEAYDITHPDQPEKIWSVGGNIVQSFIMDGDQIYAFGWTILSEFIRYVVSVPEPILGSPVGITGSVTAVHNGHFLIAYDSLEIYQPIDPDGLKLVGIFQAPVTNAIGISITESEGFVVDRGIGFGSTTGDLLILDLPDLKPLGNILLEYPTWNWFNGMALDSDRIYLATHDSLSVYAVSGMELTFLNQVEISDGGVEAIAVLSDPVRRLLVVAQQAAENSLLNIYDLTNLENPELVGEPLILEKNEIVQMLWSESAILAIHRPVYQYENVMLDRITFEDTTLKLRDSLLVPGNMVVMAIDRDFIALVSSKTLSIVSANAAEPLTLLGQAALPEVGMGVTFYKSSVLVAVGDDSGAAQLLAFDIQDPALPRLEGALDMPVSKLNQVPIMASDPYIVIANGVGGVEVLRYEP
jgi:hypothetical protein